MEPNVTKLVELAKDFARFDREERAAAKKYMRQRKTPDNTRVFNEAQGRCDVAAQALLDFATENF